MSAMFTVLNLSMYDQNVMAVEELRYASMYELRLHLSDAILSLQLFLK